MKLPLFCPKCKTKIVSYGDKVCCRCCFYEYILSNGVLVSQRHTPNSEESTVRNRQAKGYLQHSKFPTHIENFKRWLDMLPAPQNGEIALDLGCGPGPYTALLLDKGYSVMAIDFSLESLLVNRKSCLGNNKNQAVFIKEDLNNLTLQKQSCSVAVMADFLQHLGSRENRQRLLHEVFSALNYNGSFYLSFLNLNIKNYLKGDVHGGFAGGKIKYERLSPANLVRFFPENIKVERIIPMNIVHGARLDYILSKMPMAMFAARWAVIQGFRKQA